MAKLSIVLPAKNEAPALKALLPDLCSRYPDAEIIVVDDASHDETPQLCIEHGVKTIRHPYSMGNGASIKDGLRAASGEWIVCMDADGQHRPEHISALLEKALSGYDMVIAARSRRSQSSVARMLANTFYNRLASWVVEQRIEDLTSGFRVMRAAFAKEFVELLPNGFSYPTTISMAFFRAGYSVAYVPIKVEQRIGQSHISLFKDGARFLLIIFKICVFYSPLKLFVPVSTLFFLLASSHYLYTYISFSRFTNMSALLYITSVLVFLIGLVSEQVTLLIYSQLSVKK